MKVVSNDYKTAIKQMGRQIDAKITYTLNNEEIELGAEELNSVNLHYEGGILKSVMKQLDIDSNVNIPVGTILEVQFGLLVGNSYEYVNFGNFVVYSSEKQEDLSSYKIVCYDKLLWAMKEYETPKVNGANITFPITIRNYLSAICEHLGLDFGSASDTFANYDKEIPNELYLEAGGGSLNYTFRDVLDQLAQVTASTICINDSDELEVRYITNSGITLDEESLKDINVNFGEMYGAINTIIFSRSAGADNIHYPDPLPENPIEIKISDNQILNDDNRSDYFEDIYDVLNGLSYYTNDFVSTGITYLDLCDRYSVTIDGQTYSCVMLNDEIQITQGLIENIHTEMPKESVTDYSKTTQTDKTLNRTILMVDKVNQRITSEIGSIDDIRAVVQGEYVLTEDLTFQDTKTYYIQSGDDFVEYTSYNVGDPIPADTIYELQGSIKEVIGDATSSLQTQLNNTNSAIYTLRQETNSQFTQTNTSFELALNNLTNVVNTNGQETNLQFEDIKKYLRYEDGIITIGISNNPIILKIKNDKISFEQNGNEVAYISNNTLFITDGQFLRQLRIGSFAFIPRTDSNKNFTSLSFRKVD